MLISYGSTRTSQEAPSSSYTRSLVCEEHFPCFIGFYALRLKKSWMIRETLCLPIRYYHNRWQMVNLANRKPTPVISFKLLNASLKQDVFTACTWEIINLNAPCEQPTHEACCRTCLQRKDSLQERETSLKSKLIPNENSGPSLLHKLDQNIFQNIP